MIENLATFLFQSVRLKLEVDQKPVKKEKPSPAPKSVKREREDSDGEDDDDTPLSARYDDDNILLTHNNYVDIIEHFHVAHD